MYIYHARVFFVVATSIADFGRETMSVFCIYSECLMVNVMQSLVIPV